MGRSFKIKGQHPKTRAVYTAQIWELGGWGLTLLRES